VAGLVLLVLRGAAAGRRSRMICAPEGRWFATPAGGPSTVDPGSGGASCSPALRGLPADAPRRGVAGRARAARRPAGSPSRRDLRRRARHFARARSLARERLGAAPGACSTVGAGCGWAAARFLADGHPRGAVDVSLDEQDGLLAARALIDDPSQLPRAEADMEALPLEPASMDLVLAAGVLHHAARPARNAWSRCGA